MADTLPVTDVLARSTLFEALTPQERLELANEMRGLVLEPGQTLFCRGDPGKDIYLVIEGRMRFSVLSTEGRELSFSHAVPGDIFGEIAALDGGSRSADAMAISRVRLKVLLQSTLHKLLATNARAALAAIKLLCERLRDVSEHFEAVALHPVDVRLARLLLDNLADKRVTRVGQESLSLEITQSELGLLIGTTRQRANAALMALEKTGAISRSEGLVTCNVLELERIAQRG
jgi:CRP/FNR family cyclic AMP-dependent transcriptional regulator